MPVSCWCGAPGLKVSRVLPSVVRVLFTLGGCAVGVDKLEPFRGAVEVLVNVRSWSGGPAGGEWGALVGGKGSEVPVGSGPVFPDVSGHCFPLGSHYDSSTAL